MKKPVLSLEENTIGRDFVISDIHGSFDLLDTALTSVDFDKTKDRLISVGDLVNYGPLSSKSIEYLKQPWFFHLKGNHEILFLDIYKDGILDIKRIEGDNKKGRLEWLLNEPKEKLDALREAFKNLPVIIEVKTPNGLTGFVHGDIPQSLDWRTLKEKITQGDEKIINATIFSRDKVKLKDTRIIQGVDRIFLGHTPIENGPISLGNCFFIDTGAVFKHINNDNKENLYMTLADIKANAADICSPKPTKHKLIRTATVKTEKKNIYNKNSEPPVKIKKPKAPS